jgi:phage pi2 protein 07
LEEVVFGDENKAKVIYSELKELRDQLNELLDALSFNVDQMMLPAQYSEDVIHPKGIDARPDIERILDCIAEKSYLLNMPEQHPNRWCFRQKQLVEDDLKVLNHYRIKLGLGLAPLSEEQNNF